MHQAGELTSFVGRTRELVEVLQLLRQQRLVTLAGPGGIGKTRLAMRLVRDCADSYADGAFVFELAPLTQSNQVARELAERLGIVNAETVPDALRSSAMLLVLDNCEHLIEPCAALADELLRACPRLRILATSREPLAVPGEAVFRLPPLAIPRDDSLEQLAESDAAHLFVQRARAARSDFRLGQTNAAAVARICRRLDGLPLAIELAANRLAELAPAEVADRLDSALRLLANGPRTVPARQKTLEAAIAWSYDLLEASEQRLFNRLSVFAGGFTVDAAEAVSEDGFDVLPRLVAKSMVQADLQADGSVRYRLLEPLRAFGQARLAASDGSRSAMAAQAAYVVALAERAEPELYGPRLPEWSARLDSEWDNIRLADDWLFESADAEGALRLAAALAWWWSRPDRQAEARGRLERAVRLPDSQRFPRLRARTLNSAGLSALQQSDMRAATALFDEALELARATADPWIESFTRCMQGVLRLFQGELDLADALFGAALARARSAQLAWIEARVLDMWSGVALARGEASLAESRIRESLRVAAPLDPWSRGMALNSLADLLRSRGDALGAGEAYEEALPLFRALDPRRRARHGLLHNLGYVALARGDLVRAAEHFVESAEQYRRVGTDRRGLAECLVGLASVAVRSAKFELAARLLASVDAALAELGTTVSASNQTAYEAVTAAVAAGLSPADRLRAARIGQHLSLVDALEQARVMIALPGAPPSAVLTQREAEVARLLARGLTNRQVADVLVITEKTAKNHAQKVLDKLGVRSRAQVAARATELGLRD